jgi:hypothetical protein
MKPLNGKESSVLALLAQCKGMSKNDKDRILKELSGRALRIANAIVYKNIEKSAKIITIANGFKNWAKSLRK